MRRNHESKSLSKKRKNSTRNTDEPNQWPDGVFAKFSQALSQNLSSKNTPYFVEVPMIQDGDGPDHLLKEKCHNPFCSQHITVCFGNKEYQRPLHRIRMYLKLRFLGEPIPDSSLQVSHLCMNLVNAGGTGLKQCSNPDHMVLEDDVTNKSRRGCLGWTWIHRFGNHPGGYWYPNCAHKPPCLRYRPKSMIPTELARNFDSGNS
jgi:Zinc-binding loop region of homing endonuclease